MRGLVIRYPECTMEELAPAIDLLRNRVRLETVDLANVSEELEADFALIPGGSCDLAIVHKGLHGLLQKIEANHGWVASICNGALVVASAGLLRGRNCTHTANEKYAPRTEFPELLEAADKYFEGSHYVDEDVVVSGRIITAKPWAAEKFAESVMRALKL